MEAFELNDTAMALYVGPASTGVIRGGVPSKENHKVAVTAISSSLVCVMSLMILNVKHFLTF